MLNFQPKTHLIFQKSILHLSNSKLLTSVSSASAVSFSSILEISSTLGDFVVVDNNRCQNGMYFGVGLAFCPTVNLNHEFFSFFFRLDSISLSHAWLGLEFGQNQRGAEQKRRREACLLEIRTR